MDDERSAQNRFADPVAVDMDRPNTIKTFGAEIEAMDAGFARLRYRYRRDWCNPRGTLQGGMYGVFLDEAMGYALVGRYPELDTLWTTTSMTVNLLRPIAEGDIFAEGRIIRAGRRTIYTEGEVLTGDGRVAARGSAHFLVIQSPHLAG